MKALEILKKFSELHESAYGFNNVMVATLGDINNAIAELESPKSCDGCKYDAIGEYDCTHWSSKQEDCCVRFNNPIDYYEPKE